jgi:hypothetical protein
MMAEAAEARPEPKPETFIVPVMVPEDNDRPRRRRREHDGSHEGRGGNRITPVCLAIGIPLLCIGLGVVLFFGFIYDTSVPVNSEFFGERRVHNVGLMQNRLIGILVGLLTLAAGVALTIVGGVAGRKR